MKLILRDHWHPGTGVVQIHRDDLIKIRYALVKTATAPGAHPIRARDMQNVAHKITELIDELARKEERE